jgi:hypothetical protein
LDYFQEPYLVKWKLKVGATRAKEISEEALHIGTVLDNSVQLDINEDKPEIKSSDDKVNNCWKGWQKFKQDHPDFVVKMRKCKDNMQKELVLGELVGHPDFILRDEVCDLKTSKSINKSHWMQVAQYAKMWDRSVESNQLVSVIKRISILRLDKLSPEGHYEYKVLEEPFISFWQGKFQARYEAYKEEGEFMEMMRKKLETERLS